MPGGPVTLRAARPSDEAAIAWLHADSWSRTYRGVLDDAWLDEAVHADRAARWRERFASPSADQRLLVAEDEAGALAGFAAVFLDADPACGPLLENLHVDARPRGTGLGRRLLRAVAALAQAERPGAGFHLSVVAANVAARGFYVHLGGRVIGEEDWDAPDGRRVRCVRIGWGAG